MRRILLFLLLLSAVTGQAQDFKEWAVTQAELDMKSFAQDTSAEAIYLQEFGDARITDDQQENILFKYHARIKIFKTKGFDHGNIVIPLYIGDGNRFENVTDIEGRTFYTDEQGKVQTQTFNASNIFREKGSKHWEYVKFAMPNIREGCVIEYKYTLRSPFHFNLRKWDFQANIPKLYSEYIVHIPAFYEYNITLKGPLKLSKNVGSVEKECFVAGGARADCSKLIYRIDNIPAFVREDNMTSASNFLSAITFELAQVTEVNGTKHKITKEWRDIDLLLKKHESYGKQLKKTELFKEPVASITSDNPDELARAKAVYRYIKGWYKWNRQADMFSENIKRAFESHSGSTADINLSLAAALTEAGLNAETVVLSTRDNGIINKLYPTIGDFNYVIVKLNLNDKSWLLDASEPLLPFGLLPLRCINDQGRVISFDKPSYWIDMVASQKETRIYTADLTLQEDGKMKGIISKVSRGYEAFDKRNTIKSFNSVDEFVEDLDEKWAKTKVIKSKITNIDSLEESLTEIYTVEMDVFDDLNGDKFYLNPFFLSRISENPFKLDNRSYPVDLGAITDSRMIVTISLPEKFSVIGQPANIALALPGGSGKFLSTSSIIDNKIMLSEIKQLNKAIYTPDEYPLLKELYRQIVQAQKTDFVLQKAK